MENDRQKSVEKKHVKKVLLMIRKRRIKENDIKKYDYDITDKVGWIERTYHFIEKKNGKIYARGSHEGQIFGGVEKE